MEPQRKGIGANLVVSAIIYCIYWVRDDTLFRIADRCRCRSVYWGAMQTNFRFAAATAPAVIDEEKVSTIARETQLTTARNGKFAQNPFLSGKSAKRCQWQSKQADFEEAPPLARLNRAREWQWRDGGQPEGYFLFGKRKYLFGVDGRRRSRRGRPRAAARNTLALVGGFMKNVTIYTDGEFCFANSVDALFARRLRGNREKMATGTV